MYLFEDLGDSSAFVKLTSGECYGIPLSFPSTMVLLLERRKPKFVIFFIKWDAFAWKELLNLHYQVFTWISEVQGVVASQRPQVYPPSFEEHIVNAMFIEEHPHSARPYFSMFSFHGDSGVLLGFLSGKDFLIGNLTPVLTYLLDAVGDLPWQFLSPPSQCSAPCHYRTHEIISWVS